MAKEELTPVSIHELSEREQALHKQFSDAKTDEEALKIVSDPDFPVHGLDQVNLTPVIDAILFNYPKTLAALVKKKGAPLDYQDDAKQTALHKAACRPNPQMAEILIAAGASLDIQDEFQSTPLIRACNLSNYDTAVSLVNAGASLHMQNATKRTPLHELLTRAGGNIKDLVLCMIENGTPLHAKDTAGLTPMHLVCTRADGEELGIAMVDHLTAEGKTDTLNVRSKDGSTPLHYAAKYGLEAYGRALVDAGARMDIKNNKTELALHEACQSELDDLAEYMVLRGAALSSDGKYDLQQPLITCLQNGLEKTAMAILHKMRPQDLPDYVMQQNGMTDALANGMDGVAIELMKKGVALNMSSYRHSISNNFHFKDMMQQFVSHVILPQTIRQYPQIIEDMGLDSQHRSGGAALQNYETFISNMVHEVSYVLFPESNARDLVAVNKEVARIIEHNKTIKDPKDRISLNDYLDNNPTVQDFFRPTRLSKTWHHPAINIPREYVPIAGTGEWYPILKQPYAPDGHQGLSITNLTSGTDLKYESEKLDHCVGRHSGYDAKCMNSEHRTRSHILSIGSMGAGGDRIPISTIEMQVVPKNDKDITLTPIYGDKSYSLKIKQHYGQNNTPPSGAARRLLNQFLAEVKDGSVTLEMDNAKLGETQDSISKREQYSKLERTMGVPLSWLTDPKSEGYDNLGKIFDRFRMSERAATTGTDRNGRRVYDVERTDDRYTHFSHFIDGWATIDEERKPTCKMTLREKDLNIGEGEMAVSLRDLDLPSWMRASGIDQVVNWKLSLQYPHRKCVLKDDPINLDRSPIPEEKSPQTDRALVITHKGTIKPAPNELSAA